MPEVGLEPTRGCPHGILRGAAGEMDARRRMRCEALVRSLASDTLRSVASVGVQNHERSARAAKLALREILPRISLLPWGKHAAGCPPRHVDSFRLDVSAVAGETVGARPHGFTLRLIVGGFYAQCWLVLGSVLPAVMAPVLVHGASVVATAPLVITAPHVLTCELLPSQESGRRSGGRSRFEWSGGGFVCADVPPVGFEPPDWEVLSAGSFLL